MRRESPGVLLIECKERVVIRKTTELCQMQAAKVRSWGNLDESYRRSTILYHYNVNIFDMSITHLLDCSQLLTGSSDHVAPRSGNVS